MQEQVNAIPVAHRRVSWNKGKLTGAKPPEARRVGPGGLVRARFF